MNDKSKFRLFRFILIFLQIIILLTTFQLGLAQSSTDWTIPINISVSGVATNPISVIDSNGIIHVIWLDKVDGYKYAKSANGTKWTAPVAVDFPFGVNDFPPVLLADRAGFIHIFWIAKTGSLLYAQSESGNMADPKLWTYATLSNGVANFDVTVDSKNLIHLAYIENITNENGYAGVYYRRSPAGSASWTQPISLYASDYFRGSLPTNSSIHISVSNQTSIQPVFVSWDNRAQKRIFYARSGDNGNSWGKAQEFKGPNDIGGVGLPFNLSVWVENKNVLLMWQVGEPGTSKCSVFSQASTDAGASWGDVLTLFGGATACPSNIRFVQFQPGEVAALLAESGDPVLIAWNGQQWSSALPQVNLPAFSNPDTNDALLLGCRQDIFYKDKLVVVACDQSEGGDIWYLSRSLPPIDTWFSQSEIWQDPVVLDSETQTVTEMVSVADTVGNIHTLWVEVPDGSVGDKPFIQYTRWDGSSWSAPDTVIRNLDHKPEQMSLHLDAKDRLLLTWVDSSTGDVLFSWSNLQQAGFPSGWEVSTIVPTPSRLIDAPDVAADSTGRIVIAYTVSLNEDRGVYVVQSTDNGATWSPIIKAFDGVAAQWEFVESPKIAIGGDGTLHLLFTRRSTWSSDPSGLYYSRSQDGGVTWSPAQMVSEGVITWSALVAFGNGTLHRLWQENDGLVIANLSQVSRDNGVSWGRKLDVTGVSDSPSQIALAQSASGQMTFVQLTRKEDLAAPSLQKLSVQDAVWDGTNWNPQPRHELSIRNRGVETVITAGLSSTGYLGILLSAVHVSSKGEIQRQVFSLGRFVSDLKNDSNRVLPVIPVPTYSIAATSVQTSGSQIQQITPTVDTSVLFDSNNPSEGMTKNIVGLLLIVSVLAVLFVVVFIRRPIRSKKTSNDRTSIGS